MRLEDEFYKIHYERGDRKMGNIAKERDELFEKVVKESKGKNCLQIGVRDKKYAPHFVSVDKYDKSSLIDFNYDIHNLPPEWYRSFDLVVCKAVLEHVEDPWLAVYELTRILKPSGKIWVEIPFNQPYHPSPGDYWRVTPDGMRLLMRDFEEILCGTFRIQDSIIYNGVLFYGAKL